MVKQKIVLIGVFITFSAAVLVWGVNYLNGNNILLPENAYYAVYSKVNGLVKTSPVYLNGYKIGQVRDLGFKDSRSGKLVAKITIDNDLKLPKHTTAEIHAVDLTGTKGIRIIPGKQKDYHKPGDTLKSKFDPEFTSKILDQLDPIKGKAERLIVQMDTLVNKTRQIVNETNQENIHKTLANLAQVSKNLNVLVEKNQKSLNQTFARIDSFSMTLEKNNTKLDTTMHNLMAVSDSLKNSNLKSSLLAINNITKAIKKQKGSMGKLVYNDTLYYNLENATSELEKLLRDIQKDPKKYVHFSLFGK